MTPQSSPLPIYVVEAFTYNNNSLFTGNTAGVCVLENDAQISDEVKQKIALDMNLSETAFVSKRWSPNESLLPGTEWTLRWFTPTTEVPLCGHASLASARILFNHYEQDAESLVFHSKFRGRLGASLTRPTGAITLNFPASPPRPLQEVPEAKGWAGWLDDLTAATLRAPIIGQPKVSSYGPIDVQYAAKAKILLLRLQAKDHLLSISPDFQAMLEAETRGLIDLLIVTSQGDDGADFYSRVFAPWCGLNEDPVTGVAHTVLMPYWKAVLEAGSKAVPQTLVGVQLSERRGEVKCELSSDGARVSLSGDSRITIKGEFIL